MKEVISAIVIIASILGGAAALKGFHDTVRKAALEKTAQGLPSLQGMSRTLTSSARAKAEEKKQTEKSNEH